MFKRTIRLVHGQAMCTEYLEEKRELVRAIPKDRKISNIDKITQVDFPSIYDYIVRIN